jgi:hypothetical protein
MKKTITMMAIAFGFINANAQFVADFESFTLSPNSVYSSTASVPFQTTNAIFPYTWDTGFSYWAGGFAYTNKYDSATAGSGNLYGVKPLKGYNNSNIYVVGQDKGVIRLKPPYDTFDGFYITNTTYAYKSMKYGDQFGKKFGGPTGNDPDFFKVTVKGYLNGVMKPDSSVFYLADFRFANNALDYIVNTWQFVNTSILAQVDSVKFFMYSSDLTGGFINQPAYFGVDNVTTSHNFVGIAKNNLNSRVAVYPNPFTHKLNIDLTALQGDKINVNVSDVSGKIIYMETLTSLNHSIDLEYLQKGIYFVEINAGDGKMVKKLIKE